MGLRKPAAREALHEVVERALPRDIEGLCAQLHLGNEAERRWAARDLAGVAAAVPVLGRRLRDEADPRVREALFTSLCASAGEAAVDELLPLLRGDDAQLRNGAIEALAAMPRAVGPRIAALLRDADPEQVTPWLLQVLREDAEVNVVAAAIEVLAEVGGPEHVPALHDAVRRFPADPFIAFAAEAAAGRAGGG